MDGQLPPNLNGTGGKNLISGVAGGNVFLPSLFTQSQIPTSSSCPPNAANLPWSAKNQVFQNWVDQTKNLPNMYNMFAGNMAANGSFGSNLDNSWQNPSSSQSNLNLLAAFQSASQQYATGAKTNNVPSTQVNPLLGSSHLRQPPTTSFDPLSIHPTPSALNPPISQPKQPPKHAPSDSLFPSVGAGYGGLPQTSPQTPKIGTFPFPPGYDQLRELSATLGLPQQPFGQQPTFALPTPAPLARPQPGTAAPPPPTVPSQAFDLTSAAGSKSSNPPKPPTGFNLSQILPSAPVPQTTSTSSLPPQMPSTSSTIFPSSTSTMNLPGPSTSGPPRPLLSMPPAVPSISGLQAPQHQAMPAPPTSGMQRPPLSMPPTASAPSTSGIQMPGPSTTSSSAPSIQIPPTSTPTGPPSDLISPRTGQPKRRSGGGGQNGDPHRPPSEGNLDIDLDGIDLFEGMNMGDQEAVLNSTLNFDETLFSEPIIPTSTADEPPAPPPPKPVEKPPAIKEEKKEEPVSANSKMALLMARLNKTRGATADPSTPTTPAAAPSPAHSTGAPTTPAPVTPIPAVAAVVHEAKKEPLSASNSPAVFQKPATPVDKSDRLTFTPPLSPVDLSDPNKPSTSGISSLIAASILPSELMGKLESPEKKKNVPVYLRPKSTQSSALPAYKSSGDHGFIDSKEAAFDFDDDDPEDTGEWLNMKREEDSDSEQENIALAGTMKEEKFDPTKKVGLDPKDAGMVPKPEVKKPAVFPGRGKARQESLEFAEKLRKRRKESVKVDFASILQCDHNNQCAIDSVQKNVEDADKPPLPRLLIRLPKKSIGSEEKSRRRRKKRAYYEDGEDTEEEDDDWYGGRPKKRRGRKPKRELHPDETYSVRLVDPSTIEHARREVYVRPVEYMTRKERVMRNWRDDHAGHDEKPSAIGKGVEGKLEPKSLTKIVTEYKNAEARDRLDKFKHCTGYTPRGTFLVLKSEINTNDCSLWRVDNMNLLQKFPGYLERTEEGGPMRMLYKNSSTYSGWCEQLQPGYMVVEVRHVRQTRSDCVVEPLIRIDDLFPAISEELAERYCVPVLKALINKEDVTAQSDARTFILKDDVRNGLYMVIRNMLDGAISFDYFSRAKDQTVGGLSNPSFELLEEMECQIRECEEAIRDRVVFPFDFEQYLRRYSSLLVIECDMEELDCQVCGEAPVDKTLQLFDLIAESDKEDKENINDENYFFDPEIAELPAVDVLTCRVCSRHAQWQHRLIHFRNDLARRIEDRLLESTLELPVLLPEQIVDNLRQCYTWLKEVIVTHTDTWDEVLKSDDSDDEIDEPEQPIVDPTSTKVKKEEPPSPAPSEELIDPEPVQLSTEAAVLFAAASVASDGEPDENALIDPVAL